jgi:alpha-D-ribose 1-methylphosphonate 5-triphosphate synthase subunit PhnG
MALLARAPLPLLEQYLAPHLSNQSQWLRRPETGLMMVQGRAGGTGERFNLGEITVTRCTLRLGDAAGNTPVGVAYVLGRSHRHAQLAATADALLQDPQRHEEL